MAQELNEEELEQATGGLSANRTVKMPHEF